MAIWDWLRELPIIDDVADALDISAEFVPDAEIGTGGVGDYADLREGMYWTVGEDGLDTRERLLTEVSREPVAYDEQGDALSGLWRDPHTGFESNDPSDFDVDHRVPFRVVADEFPQLYELPRDEQLAVYNDPENLQVIHDVHNLEKGDDAPAERALAFADADAQEEFLRKCADYMGRLRERFN